MEAETISINEKSVEVLKNIFERRSVKKYKDIPVDKEIIEKIVDAGRMAPSAHNIQPWKFYILTKRDTIRLFSKEIAKVVMAALIKEGPMGVIKIAAAALYNLHLGDLSKGPDPVFYNAPVVVFLTAPGDNEWAIYDVNMCAQNMMLAAKSLGLDSCPLGIGKYVEHTKIFYKLQIPFPDRVLLALIFGYGDESPKAHKRIRDNVFYID
jgi:nitroreductase